MNINIILSLILFFTFSGIHTSKAAIITAVTNNGQWTSGSSWNLNRIPIHNDTIVIPQNITINVGTMTGAGGSMGNPLNNILVIVDGGLFFINQAKLHINCNSMVIVNVGGFLYGNNTGAKISYCGSYEWRNDDEPTRGLYIIGGILPVELLSFSGEHSDGENIMQWQTASETNNSYFLLEKGNSSSDFQMVTTIPGAGNSNIPLTYSYTDPPTSEKLMYYRLTQFDYDGTSEVLGIIAIQQNQNLQTMPVSFPNPVNSEDLIEISISEPFMGSLKIIGINGAVVFETFVSTNDHTIFADNLPKGIYFVHIETGKSRNTSKLVIL